MIHLIINLKLLDLRHLGRGKQLKSLILLDRKLIIGKSLRNLTLYIIFLLIENFNRLIIRKMMMKMAIIPRV